MGSKGLRSGGLWMRLTSALAEAESMLERRERKGTERTVADRTVADEPAPHSVTGGRRLPMLKE